MLTYFITGGGGNLARHVSRDLLGEGHRVVLFDRAEPTAVAKVPPCEYVLGDLTRPGDVEVALKSAGSCRVLHLASLLSGECERDRGAAWQINVTATLALFEAALEADVETFLFASTVATYGGPLPNPVPQDHPQWPVGLYGASKVAVERMGHYYHAMHGLDYRCVRLPLVLSRFAHAGAASAYASLAYVEAVSTGSYTFRVNPSTRVASIYVGDAVNALIGLTNAPAEKLTRRTYTIQAISPTAQELADAIEAHLDTVRIGFDPDPELVRLVESWPQAMDDEAARRDWGWQPRYDLERTTADFIEELRRETADARRV